MLEQSKEIRSAGARLAMQSNGIDDKWHYKPQQWQGLMKLLIDAHSKCNELQSIAGKSGSPDAAESFLRAFYSVGNAIGKTQATASVNDKVDAGWKSSLIR
jgi:hypothetical protein